jgi:Domain of unknown function (DUF4397)
MRAGCIALGTASCAALCGLGCDPTSSSCTMNDAQAGEAGSDALMGDASGDARAPVDGMRPNDAAGDARANAESSASPTSFLRFANWSPDSPGVDVCIAPHGSTDFRGPLVQQVAEAREAGVTSLGFPLVSAYLALAPGRYDARLVVSLAGTCAVGIGPDTTNLPALAAGTFATFALVGEELPAGGDPGLQVVGFTDTTSSGSGVSLRFINASPALAAVDFGKGSISGSASAFKPLFTGVLFGHAGAMSPVASPPATSADASPPLDAPAPTDASTMDAVADAPASKSTTLDPNGYLLNQSLSGTPISAHDTRAGMDAVSSTLTAAPGSVLTIALIGGTSGGVKPEFLECVDNAGTAGELEDCTLLP